VTFVRQRPRLTHGLLADLRLAACTNLANLVLARGTTRQRELAIKCALGASRWRLVREQCTESLLIAIAGAVASYVAFQGLRLLLSTDFNLILPFGGGHWTMEIRPAPNMSALVMAIASLLLSLLVFGLEPAWQLTRSLDVRGALATGAGVGRPRARRQRCDGRSECRFAPFKFSSPVLALRIGVPTSNYVRS